MNYKLITLLFFSFYAFSQEKVQIGINSLSNQVRVINLKENGAIQLNKATNGVLEIKKFDQNLNLVWEIEAEVPNKSTFLEEYIDQNFLYILLETKHEQSLKVLKISTTFAASQFYNIKAISDFEVTHFQVFKNNICLGGLVKEEPLLVFYDQNTGSTRFVSTNLKGQTSLQSLNISEDEVEATFLHTYKKTSELVFRVYNQSGKVVATKLIVPKKDFEFTSAKYFNVNNQNLIVGSYGFKSGNKSGQSPSQGIFVTNLNENVESKYYSFDQFKTFFGFLNEKQQERITKQVSKKKSKGDEYRYNYRLFINDLNFVDSKLIMSFEVFVPEYKTSNNFGSSFMGYPYNATLWGRQTLNSYYFLNNRSFGNFDSRNMQNFDGFKYIEGIVLAINENGEMLWDQSMQYKNLKYYNLRSHLKVSNSESKTLVSFVNDEKLQLKEFSTAGQILKSTALEIDPAERQSRRRKSEFENFEYWYQNYFVNWGVVKNTDPLLKEKMSCFIKKIPF